MKSLKWQDAGEAGEVVLFHFVLEEERRRLFGVVRGIASSCNYTHRISAFLRIKFQFEKSIFPPYSQQL